MTADADVALIRALWLFVPAILALLMGLLRPPSRSEAAGMIIASAWCLPILSGLNAMAPHVGWWRFHVEGGLLAGVPVDALIGWTLLWAVLPQWLLPRAPLWVLAPLALWLDALTMPLCAPALELDTGWLEGECLAIAVALLPAQWAARATRDRRALAARVGFQVACFSLLSLGLIPVIVFEWTADSWAAFLSRDVSHNALLLQVIALPGVLSLAGVQEFALRGRGTPLPYDAPLRLVTSGPYAYVRNPMQLGMTAVLLALGVTLGSVWIAMAALLGVFYSAGLAAWHEDLELEARFGDEWGAYRSLVRAWLPRWRPVVLEPARLYYAAGCDPCEGLAGWLSGLGPWGLELLPAQEFPGPPPDRLTYLAGGVAVLGDAGHGGAYRASGVSALARALEHVHFGWAMLGFALRLPIVTPFVQLLVDVSGGAPRKLAA